MTDDRIDAAAATAEETPDSAVPTNLGAHPGYVDQAKGLAKKLMDVVTGRGSR